MNTHTTASKRDQSFNPSPKASEALLKLWKSKPSHLGEVMKEGLTPSRASLEGWNFRGINVGLPARLVGRRKFIKSFYPKEYGYGHFLTGHNILVEQNAPEDEYVKKVKNDTPVVQGFYLIERAKGNPWWHKYPQATLLNYGKGDNAWHELARALRDYLVQPYPDNPDILLGRAYFAFGPLTLPAGYFVLERLEKADG